MPSGALLAAELWAGVTPSSLQKVAITSFDGYAEGRWNNENVILPGYMPGGAQYYFQVKVYDSAAGSYENSYWWRYSGQSPVFTCYASSTAAYYSISQTTSPAFSTWAPGTRDESGYLPGAMGSIELIVHSPEPSASALWALSAALAVLARRRVVRAARVLRTMTTES